MSKAKTQGDRGTLRIESRLVADLSNDPANARKHNETNIAAIVASLRRFGQQKPIVIDSNNVVRAGNGTLEAARQLGWDSIQCVVTSLKGSDAIAYAIADNRTAELAEWDDEILAAQLNGLLSESEEIALAAGFTAEEVEEMVALSEDDPEIVEDEAPEPPVDPITKLGDLWILGEHRLLCGDSSDQAQVDRLLAGATIDCVLTDPPYGINYDAEKSTQQGIQKFKKLHGDHLPFDASKWIGYKDVFAWCLPQHTINLPIGSGCWYAWDKVTQNDLKVRIGEVEFAWHKNATKTRMFRHLWSGAYRASESGQKSQHPTQKPVAVMMWCLDIVDDAKQIFDPFSGSGSTLIACEQSNRSCYAMEFEPRYCDVIIDRWENLTGQKAVLSQ